MKRLRPQKPHPFLALCLSMVWISIASEALHFTDGRLSSAGSLALMGVAAGLVLYCVVSVANRALCDRVRQYLPLVAAALCLAMLLPFGREVLSALYGISCGLFLAAALIAYLPHAGKEYRLFKIGLSAGIYTTAVYPFGVLYTLLAPTVSPAALRLTTFAALAALAVAIFLLHTTSQKMRINTVISAPAKYNSSMILMVAVVIALATFNHLLNSGVLEQNGGTANAPTIFFVNVALRLPMGALMGYFADKGRWQYAIGLPLTLMIGGCAVSLFAGGAVGDYAMLSAFNCGGAAIVMFIHVLGMQTALWRGNNAFAACFGSLTHFVLVAFFNMNALGISSEHFAEALRRPLTFAVIVTGLPAFWLIMHFLVNERLRESIRTFFSLHPVRIETPQPPKDATETPLTKVSSAEQQAGFSAQEQNIALLLIEGNTQHEISRRLHLPSAEVNSYVRAIQEKVTGGDGRGLTIAAAAREYHLTRRETDMLRCLQSGMTNNEIAELLVLSEETVKIHVRNLLRKLSLDSRLGVKAWLDAYAEKTE